MSPLADDSPSSVAHRPWSDQVGRNPFAAVVTISRTAVEGTAFWAAALLPVVYLPLFALASVSGLDVTLGVWLMVAHAIAIVVGHRYGQ